ncbi:unnamed protein product, partial [Adineta ricciae]
MSVQEVETEVKITPTDPLILSPTITNKKQPRGIHQFSGVFYALFSSFLFTFSTFTIRQLGVDLLDALLIRFSIQLLLTLSFALHKKYTLLSGTGLQVFLQIICALTGAGGFVLFSLALR